MAQFISASAAAMAAISTVLLFGQSAQAQQALPGAPVTIVTANPAEQPAAAIARQPQSQRQHRPLPFGPATDAAKAAATAEAARATRSTLQSPTDQSATSPSPAMTVLPGLNFPGIPGGTAMTLASPSDSEGAIGPYSYIQTVNMAARIYNRTTHAIISGGSLNQLGGNASTVDSFDPQIIWDPTTNRYYYAMDSIYANNDNRIAFGFSKSASPTNLTSAWCHYHIKYGTAFPDYPKLGDSKYFTIIGVNVFANNYDGGFTGSDIVAVAKPAGTATITTCPTAGSFKQSRLTNIKDSFGSQAFTPVPANQIDDTIVGRVVASPSPMPFDKLWFFDVLRSSTGWPVFSKARSVTVPTFSYPPNVLQGNSRYLDSMDARMTQAIQAGDPRLKVQAFWTQHTVRYMNTTAVRWYEINPGPATPVILRTGLIASSTMNYFNAAISPDRAKRGTSTRFGGSFVIQYNAANTSTAPRLVARSSRNGGPLSAPQLVVNGSAPYVDSTCPVAGNTCRWGDYAAATPDPAPPTTGTGAVWSTNQYSGLLSPTPDKINWRTRIFAIQP